MTGLRLQIDPRAAYRAVLAAGLLVLLGANLPGHLSYDSVAQLYEGHFHVRETWGPAPYAWILGLFQSDVIGPHTGTGFPVRAGACRQAQIFESLKDTSPASSGATRAERTAHMSSK